MTVKLHPLAEEDLKEALDYYFDIDVNLETKFLTDLESTFNRILNFQISILMKLKHHKKF